jgi:hypothetical protein
MKSTLKIFLLAIGHLLALAKVYSQAVNEPVENSIYEYLNRHAQKGNIEYNDMLRPLFRNQISE